MNYQQQQPINTMQEPYSKEKSIVKITFLLITLGGAAYLFGKLTTEIKEEIDLFLIKN